MGVTVIHQWRWDSASLWYPGRIDCCSCELKGLLHFHANTRVGLLQLSAVLNLVEVWAFSRSSKFDWRRALYPEHWLSCGGMFDFQGHFAWNVQVEIWARYEAWTQCEARVAGRNSCPYLSLPNTCLIVKHLSMLAITKYLFFGQLAQVVSHAEGHPRWED